MNAALRLWRYISRAGSARTPTRPTSGRPKPTTPRRPPPPRSWACARPWPPAPPTAERAEAPSRQALALAEELGMRPLVAHCHLGLGTLYRKIGRHEQARSELATALELYREMDMPYWLARAETALAAGRG